MNYINYLGQRLNIIRNNLNIENNIEVYEEQAFLKHELIPDTIYLVVRFLSADIGLTGIKEQPVNIVVMSEQNSLENAKAIMQRFAETYNWKEETIDNTYLKQSYSSPFIISNFEDIASGFRSVLYLSATLQIMENVVDVDNLQIDGVDIKPLGFKANYNMTGNTQQIPPEYLSETVKSVSTLGFNFSLPLRDTYFKEVEDEIDITNQDVEVIETETNYLVKFYLNEETIQVSCDIQNEGITIENGLITIEFNSQEYEDFDRNGARITYIYKDNLLKKFIKIALGQISGNTSFTISFSILGVNFTKQTKCIICEIDTAPNTIPTISIGIML